jgi:hypothetical protein
VTLFAFRNVTPTDNSLQKCVHLPPEMMASYLALETKTFLRVYLSFLQIASMTESTLKAHIESDIRPGSIRPRLEEPFKTEIK